MAPRKKARLPSQPADLNELPAEEVEQTPAQKDVTKIGSDSWTDEQETSLFKGMIRWKPVGMHKHFRMVAISQHLRNHGYTSPRDDHTRIPYIWEKLKNLYNLEALEERENLLVAHTVEGDERRAKEPFCPFTLPADEYGEMMFAKRLAPEGVISPESVKPTRSEESDVEPQPQSAIADNEGPPPSPTPAPPAFSQKSARGTRGKRRSHLQMEASRSLSKRGGRKASTDEGKDGNKKETEENDDIAAATASPKPKSRRGGRRR